MILAGDCLEVMAGLDDASVDAVVTDPPYGINFMGKAWDGADIERQAQQEREAEDARRREGRGVFRLTGSPDNETRQSIERTGSAFATKAGAAGSYDFGAGRYGDERDWSEMGGPTGRDNRTHSERGGAMHAGKYGLTPRGNRGFQAWIELWGAELLRLLKPGGHALVFGGTRTYHRLACGLEEAGFEIRDTLCWLFGSGFPKSRNLVGDWQGWGTALKPAFEPIVVARKPLVGTVAANVLAHGVGALNIDGCRVAADARPLRVGHGDDTDGKNTYGSGGPGGGSHAEGVTDEGRWPANVVLDEEAAQQLDEQTGELAAGNHPALRSGRDDEKVYGSGWSTGTNGDRRPTEAGGASRFFYCAKVSRAERNAGLDGFAAKALNWSSGEQNPGSFQADGTDKSARNHHPTVKPIELMRWLCRLVTPPAGTILDPFLGSGTTGCAAALEDFAFVGIEREPDYLAIAEARIRYWSSQPKQLDLLADGAA